MAYRSQKYRTLYPRPALPNKGVNMLKILLGVLLMFLTACKQTNSDGKESDSNSPYEDDTDTDIFADMSNDEAAPLFFREAVIEIRLSLPEDAWEALIADAQAEEYTPASVTIMGERRPSVQGVVRDALQLLR
jgi:hypothetical protein